MLSQLPDVTAKPTIMIVDDDPMTIDLLIAILGQINCNIIDAHSGEQALQKSYLLNIDLILLDIILPDLSGINVCKELRGKEKTKDVPIIFLTSLQDINYKIEGFQAGGNDYIFKPAQAEEVIAKVNTHIKLYFLQRRLYAEVHFCEELKFSLEEYKKELEKANQNIKMLSGIDDITQTANRYRLEENLQQEWRRMARETLSLGLIVFNIDDFKAYLYNYGHQLANQCLQRVALEIKNVIKRPADLIGRYKGDVLMMVAPNTPYEGVMHLARVLKNTIEHLEIPHEQSTISKYITISLGVSCTIPHHKAPVDAFIKAASEGLKTARQNGGNCIVFKEYHYS